MGVGVRKASDEQEEFFNRRADLFVRAIRRLARCIIKGEPREEALYRLAGLIRGTLVLSDLYGRRRLLLEVDSLRRSRRATFTALPTTGVTPIVPHVPFEEAVNDLITRDPRLAKGYEAVARLYSQGHVFAMAKAAEGKVSERIAMARTKSVQTALAGGIERGESLYDFTKIMKEIGPWTQSYAEVVYRTNMSTAYNHGRMEQARDPDTRETIPAMRYESMSDKRVRPNHKAADGLIADSEDPIWKTMTPPLGYNCRCGIVFVSKWELKRKGLLKDDGTVVRYEPPSFRDAGPDPGFKPNRVSF